MFRAGGVLIANRPLRRSLPSRCDDQTVVTLGGGLDDSESAIVQVIAESGRLSKCERSRWESVKMARWLFSRFLPNQKAHQCMQARDGRLEELDPWRFGKEFG